MAKKHLSERPWWKLIVQIMTIFTGLAALGIAVWVGVSQLKEMQKRPFLSLAFIREDAISTYYSYSLFLSREETAKKQTFTFGVVNSGPIASVGGKVLLAIPFFLKVDDSILQLVKRGKSGVDPIRRRPDLDNAFGGSVVFEIPFGSIYAAGNFQDVVTFKLSMPDTNLARFREDGEIAWPLVYKILADDDDDSYRHRWLWVYFGIDEKSSKAEKLKKRNYEKNLPKKGFRP